MGCENLHLSPKCKRLVSHIVSFAYFTILRIRTTRDSASPRGDSHISGWDGDALCFAYGLYCRFWSYLRKLGRTQMFILIQVSLGQVPSFCEDGVQFQHLTCNWNITAAFNWFEELVSVQCSLFLESEPRPNWSLLGCSPNFQGTTQSHHAPPESHS